MKASLCLFGTLALCAMGVACAGSSDAGDGIAANGAITGSMADAKACAVRDAYARAQVSDLTPVEVSDLPRELQSSVQAWETVDAQAKFDVKGVGTVYIIERSVVVDRGASTVIDFTDQSGKGLLTAYVDRAKGATKFVRWVKDPLATVPDARIALQCTTGAPGSGPGVPAVDAGEDAAASDTEDAGASDPGEAGACDYPCNDYDFSEGQCAHGFVCTDGCLVKSAACSDPDDGGLEGAAP